MFAARVLLAEGECAHAYWNVSSLFDGHLSGRKGSISCHNESGIDEDAF
jgi:hypothetical protein